MPHLTLELSNNVLEKEALPDLLARCHSLLVDTLAIDISGCKSRAMVQPIYCIGDGKMHNAFVHADLKILAGRSSLLLEQLGHQLIDLLRSHFTGSLIQLNLHITLEISELPSAYFKVAS